MKNAAITVIPTTPTKRATKKANTSSTQTQQRMLSLLEHRDLRPKIKRKWMGTGQQMIEMRQ